MLYLGRAQGESHPLPTLPCTARLSERNAHLLLVVRPLTASSGGFLDPRCHRWVLTKVGGQDDLSPLVLCQASGLVEREVGNAKPRSGAATYCIVGVQQDRAARLREDGLLEASAAPAHDHVDAR